MKSKDSSSPLRLLGKDTPQKDESTTPMMDASVLAKLAADVIAWNRQLNPSDSADTVRPAQVAELGSLKCGLKILRKEETPEKAEKTGELRRLFKE